MTAEQGFNSSQENVETQKANIEQRRKEELATIPLEWINTGTIFIKDTFEAKDGNTYSVKITKRKGLEYFKAQIIDEEGNEAASAVFYKREKNYFVDDLYANKQGIGLAVAMYDYVSSHYAPIIPSNTQRLKGGEFWRKNKQKLVDEINAKYDTELKNILS